MRTRRRVGVALVGLAVLFALPAIPALAATSPGPASNPDLAASCGLDISLVLDRSGSIGSNNTKVQQAAQTFVDALVGTGSRVQVVSFATEATSEPGGGSSLASLAFNDPASLVIPTFPSSGTTNWDDALEMVRRSPAGQAPLVVMITDGDPTRRNESSPDGHGGGLAGDNSTEQADLDQAVVEANLIKAAGDHMFVVGVGSALSNATSENRIKALTGTDKLAFSGGVANIDFGQADYTLVSEFSALQTMVARFVRELCAPSLNVVKVLQQADGTTVPAGANDSFTFNASLSPTPSAWTSPAQALGASATLATTDGVANFDWDPATLLAPTTVILSEQPAPGYTYNGIRCWLSDLDGSPAELVVNDVGSNAVGASKSAAPRVLPAIGAYQAMNCEVVNRQIRTAVVSVDKVTQPGGLPDAFSFSLRRDGSTLETLSGITDGTAATPFAAVAPGIYDVIEAPSAHFSTTSSCDNLLTGGVEQSSASGLVLAEATRWQCTFTNSLHDGSVRVVKDLDGAPAGTFSFTSTIPGHASFSLQPTAGVDASTTFSVAPGTYAISEVAPAPFAMVASCSGQSDPTHVIVRPDEQTTCTFTNTAPAPTIAVTKSASAEVVSEPGGPVAFTVTVTNQSVEPLTIDAVTDTVGAVTIDVLGLVGPGNTCGALDGAVVQPGQSVDCTFTIPVQGNGGASITDTVEVVAVDGDGNDATDDASATVRVVDVAPTISLSKSTSTPLVAEPGGPVVYDVAVTNTSDETVTLTSLTDRIGGGAPLSLQAVAGPITQTICALVAIPAGATYTCNFTAVVTGDAGANVSDVVTAVAVDDDGSPVSGSDDATVQLTDVLPDITVQKTAGSSSVPEPGGAVTFTVDITNDTAEAVWIDAITDAVDGAPAAAVGGTCAALVGTMLAGHGHVSCTFTIPVLADASDGPVTDLVVVTVSDDDDHTTTGADGASVAITDVAPTVSVAKTAGVSAVAEPGGTVIFTVEVTNTSAEPVSIDSILDSVDGGPPIDVATLPGTCADLVGDFLPPATTTSCTFELLVVGTPAADVEDVVTVSVGDDDGNQATATANAAVAITDLLPSITAAKVASAASVSEPGTTVTYTVEVSNSSDEPVTLDELSDVVGTDPAIDITSVEGTTCSLPQVLAVDDDYTCTFTLPVTGDAGETVTDVVTATAHDDEGNDASATGTAAVGVTDVLPTVEVTKDAVTETLAAPGGSATFEVTVVNTSPEPVTIDAITDAIDGQIVDVTVVADPVSATTCEEGVTLGATGTDSDTYECTFTLQLAQTEAGEIDDLVTVVVRDDEDNEASADDDASTTITASADLAIVKAVTTVPVVGQSGQYSLTVTNAGPSTAVEVRVIDQLPAGLTATAAAGDGWICAIAADRRTVTCDRPSLAPGATATVLLTVAAGQPGAGGTFTNVATVSSPTPDPDATDNTDDVTVSPVIVLGEVITPVVADSRGSLPATGSTVQPWLVAAAVSLLAGLWLLHGELSLSTHGQRGALSVPSVRNATGRRRTDPDA